MAQPRVVNFSNAAFLSGSHRGEARNIVVKSGVSLIGGCIMAYNTSTNLHEPYVHSGSNGTGTPVCILGQNIDTTTAGNGASVQDCMAWFSGTFIVAGLNIGGSAGGDVYYVAAAVAGGGFWQVRSTGELHIA